MKEFPIYSVLVACGLALGGTSLLAADAKSYQVTGPVLDVTTNSITVENKDNERWQIAADAATLGKVKIGDKVTIKYQMIAKEIEVKGDKPKAEAKGDKPKVQKK